IALLVFGPQKLPEIAKQLAKGLKEIRKAGDDLRSNLDFDLDDDRPRRPATQRPPMLPGAPLADAAIANANEVMASAGVPDVPPNITGSELANNLPATNASASSGEQAAAPDGASTAALHVEHRPAQVGGELWPKRAEGTLPQGALETDSREKAS
ncbi:MAG TPA: twin-arginine translocase TatA/TatE family subunit, partial [Myxococcota bacterium]